MVGEPGSDNSQTRLARMVLPAGNDPAEGSVSLDDKDILNLPQRALTRLRGNPGHDFPGPDDRAEPVPEHRPAVARSARGARGMSRCDARARCIEARETTAQSAETMIPACGIHISRRFQLTL